MRPACEELVREFGSPLFVYDGDAISRAYRRLRAAMPAACSIHYAMKANPSLAVLELLVGEGAGIEIASEGELAAALHIRCPTERILYAGPGKREVDLEAAVDAGITGIHCESAGELRRLNAIAGARGLRVSCGVRIHADWSAGEERPIIGGSSPTKFGITEREARLSVPAWNELRNLKINRLHVFNASNVLDAKALLAGAKHTFELASDLADAGLPLECVDVGGGLGVPYSPDDLPLDVEQFGMGLDKLLRRTLRERGHRFQMAIEPGRWLVAEAGEYFATVVDLKQCDEVQFAVMDGGVNHMIRPALVGQPHPVRLLRQASDEVSTPPVTVRVVGPLCTSVDSFGDHLLPPLQIGDVLAIGCAGAYGFTESMPLFLSHAIPAEVFLVGGQAHLARDRREAATHLDGQHSLGSAIGTPG